MRLNRHAPPRSVGLGGRLAGGIGWLHRTVVTRLALLMIAGWITVLVLLPRLASAPEADAAEFGGLLPAHSNAVQTERRVLDKFPLSLNPATCVVVHQPHRLDLLARADAYAWALSFTQHYLDRKQPQSDQPHILAALPVPTSTADTVVTYLYLSPDVSQGQAVALADRYAAHFRVFPGVRTYVTGLTPAQQAQQEIISDHLLWFRIFSLIAVALIVGLTFRTVLPAVAVLLVAVTAYYTARSTVYLLASHLGYTVSDQIDPIVAALVLGVVTDYALLFFQDFRERVASGLDHGGAVRATLKREAPVVTVAGLTVAGGTAALLTANLKLFQAFGPALSLSVLIGLAASLTLTPAIMTLLGHRLMRPLENGADAYVAPTPSRATRLAVRGVSRPATAAVVVVVGVALLLGAGSLALGMRLGASFAAGLPPDNEVRQGAEVLDHDGISGVTGPTDVLIETPHISTRAPALARLQHEVAGQPGVAEVFGPADELYPARKGVFYARSGDAARMFVIFDSDPLAADAITDLRQLQDRVPQLARRAGLPSDVRLSTTGETAIASELSDITRTSLVITVLAAIGVELLILALFLRALVTPIVLLACGALTVAAAFGLTTWLFQNVRGDPDVAFYAPFATAVLLFALGSDYNVFGVGNIWQEARQRPLREAIKASLPRSSRAIAAAGVTLAATMAIVAVIPIESFREIAFTMGVGLLIDTMLVRPLVVPAVLALLGRAAGWPGRRIRVAVPPGPPQPAAAVPTERSTR